MSYIDGYLLPVPGDKVEEYTEHARAFAQMLKEEGALRVVEAWNDDVARGSQTDFFRAVDAADNERLVFSFVIWPSKAARDEGTARMRARPEFRAAFAHVPVDGKRMMFGGFAPFVDV